MLQDLELTDRLAELFTRLNVFVGLFFQDVHATDRFGTKGGDGKFGDPLYDGVSAVDIAKDGIGADLDILE